MQVGTATVKSSTSCFELKLNDRLIYLFSENFRSVWTKITVFDLRCRAREPYFVACFRSCIAGQATTVYESQRASSSSSTRILWSVAVGRHPVRPFYRVYSAVNLENVQLNLNFFEVKLSRVVVQVDSTCWSFFDLNLLFLNSYWRGEFGFLPRVLV